MECDIVAAVNFADGFVALLELLFVQLVLLWCVVTLAEGAHVLLEFDVYYVWLCATGRIEQ